MDWGALGKKLLSGGLPLLGGALLGPGGAGLGAMVAETLGLETDDPASIAMHIDQNPDAMIKLKQLQLDHRERLAEIKSSQVLAEIQAQTAQQAEINKTMRAELQSDSGYKSGWRPMFGWLSAFGCGFILFALVYSIFKNPSDASDILDSATVIITIMLTVLGINIKKRSDDKQTATGQAPLGIMTAVAQRIAQGGQS